MFFQKKIGEVTLKFSKYRPVLVICLLTFPVFLFDITITKEYNRGIVHEGMMYDGVRVLLHDSFYSSLLPSSWNKQPLYDIFDEIMNTPTVENPSKDLIWKLYEGSDWEDEHTSDQYNHAWNPYNLYGITPGSGAGFVIGDLYKSAIDYYKDGDLDNAYFYVGRCLHLIQDCTVPMHSHVTMYYHHDYESLCDQEYYNHIPYSGIEIDNGSIVKNYYVPPRDWRYRISPEAWIQDAALKSYDYYKEVIKYKPVFELNNLDVTIGPQEWIDVAAVLIPYGIRLTASFLLYFYLEANNIDYDNDTLNPAEEKAARTDYTNSDTDEDGLTDAEEVRVFFTSPISPDTDQDGLTDLEEIYTYETNPISYDSDLDELSDGEEILRNTDPKNFDSDGDMFGDGEEVLFYFTNPKDSNSNPLFILSDSYRVFMGPPNSISENYLAMNNPGEYFGDNSFRSNMRYRLYEKEGIIWIIIFLGTEICV